MRSIRHWTPRYIWNRVEYSFYKKFHPEAPWLTEDAVNILGSWLKPSDLGFEWGAGRSTAWFARRVRHLTTIEHNAEWYGKVKDALQAAKIKNCDLLLQLMEGEQQSTYVQAINSFQPNSLDFVLVDGKLRDHCARYAIKKIRQGGLLILDDAHRYLPNDSHTPNSIKGKPSPKWEDFLEEIAAWRCIWTTNGISDTALFLKPI